MDNLELLLSRTTARLDAIELALQAVIGSHPRPDLAKLSWDRSIHRLVEKGLQNPQPPSYQDRLKAELSDWSTLFHAAANSAKGQ